ncbi:MAG: cation-translocating P-type ATPase [Gemmatimonadales bacterium]
MPRPPTSTAPGTGPAWHTLARADVLRRLDAPDAGLSSREAADRLARVGPNRLPEAPSPSWWLIALRQFKSPLIYILAGAAVVSVLVGHAEDAIFIGIVLALNGTIGTWQEWRAEQNSRALQKLLHIRATVLRDGEVMEMDAEELVPGDIVRLESGNRVPADLRLDGAQGLEVDESLLTGESLAVLKDSAWLGAAGTPAAERLNMAHAGSVVARGRSRGLVVATGPSTLIGQLAIDVGRATGGRPPLLVRMERFGHLIAWGTLTAATLIATAGILLRGYAPSEMFLFGVALAVSAIPEGLPVALTVALAIATTRMARRGVIVRRLAAVEGLGSCTMIASDKTGTLTVNELTVREVLLPSGDQLTVSGEGFAPTGEVTRGDGSSPLDDPQLADLARAAVLCNEGDLHQAHGEWVWVGDPTDIALLAFGHKHGLSRPAALDATPEIVTIPFEAEQQFSAAAHRGGDGPFLVVKGAPERVLGMCRWDGGDRTAEVLQAAEKMAARGFRVLGLAEGPLAEGAPIPAEPTGLKFLGFVGMIDPLRAGAREAVATCQSAGVTVVMITGDHPVTALAIARELGFARGMDEVVTGRQLADLSAEALRELMKTARVFARTSPRQKLELVEAARAAGHFVAVTGDGVNDAPALRAANIGVAMGKAGTDVAREAAELVITDDNFATIVSGVEEGRIAFANVRKVIYLVISTGAAEVLLLGFAVLSGWPASSAGLGILPLLPVQILWLNLVTNGIQDVALAFEPGEGGELARPPRPPDESIFNRLMIERVLVAAIVMAGVSFAAFWWMIEVAEMAEASARNALLLLLVLFQNVHIGNCRSETRSAFALSPLRSPILMAGALTAFLVHLAAMHLPLTQRVLQLEPVTGMMWVALPVLALSIIVVMELHKLHWRRRHP